MSFYHDSFVVPDFENEKLQDILPIAEFIKNRLSQCNLSLRTAQDERERDELLSSMILCNASLTLLGIAYIAEADALISAAKELMRETHR